jgi:TetR/AcrR family transcriptional repressor of nem operon
VTAQGRDGDTAGRILDAAEALVQVRGFNGFSYADVASELGVTKAALHYHFAGKAELGHALVSRYASRFAGALEAIDAVEPDAPRKLAAYAQLYLDVLQHNRMCLCGMLAAEYQTLPGPIRESLVAFFDNNERWLGAVLDAGRAAGTVHFNGSPAEAARMIVGALEGAMLLARPYGDAARFETAAAQLIDGLTAGAPAGTSDGSGARRRDRAPGRRGQPPSAQRAPARPSPQRARGT